MGTHVVILMHAVLFKGIRLFYKKKSSVYFFITGENLRDREIRWISITITMKFYHLSKINYIVYNSNYP